LFSRIARQTIENQLLNISLGFIAFEANITDISVQNSSISNSTSSVVLLDQEAILNISAFVLNLTFNYAYISDPPIFADIGSAFILVDNFGIVLDGIPIFEDDHLSIDL